MVTVAHVVDQAVVVSLIDGSQTTTGSVVGIDRTQDLALVRAARPLNGYHFRLAPRLPAIGDDVAAIGFPLGDPITFTRGNISGLNRNVPIDGTVRNGLIETDTAINPGNSGGPLITGDGTVVGLIDAKNTQASGIGYAVPTTHVVGRIPEWTNQQGLPAATCSDPLGPSQTDTTIPTLSDLSPGVAAGVSKAFEAYFGGINRGDYAAAWAVLGPRLQGTSSRSLAEGDATSYDFNFNVLNTAQVDSSTARVTLAFTSIQRADKGPDGDTCDDWTLTYTLSNAGSGTWLIDRASPYGGATHSAC